MLSLPELGISALLFILTLLICYVIWRILFGKRLPVKDKETSVAKNKHDAECPLNEIMGYDFIQVKNIKQEAENNIPPVPNAAEPQPEDVVLYATSRREEYNGELEGESVEEISEEDILNVTSEDIEMMANEPWDTMMPVEQQQMMANYFNTNFPYEDGDDDDADSSVIDMEHEAEFDRYREDSYLKLEEAFRVEDDEKNDLLNLVNELESSEGGDIDDSESAENYESDTGQIEDDDIPEI